LFLRYYYYGTLTDFIEGLNDLIVHCKPDLVIDNDARLTYNICLSFLLPARLSVSTPLCSSHQGFHSSPAAVRSVAVEREQTPLLPHVCAPHLDYCSKYK